MNENQGVIEQRVQQAGVSELVDQVVEQFGDDNTINAGAESLSEITSGLDGDSEAIAVSGVWDAMVSGTGEQYDVKIMQDNILVESASNTEQDFLSAKHRLAVEVLGVNTQQAKLLVNLFHKEFYRRRSDLCSSMDEIEVFQHFLSTGLFANQAPGPFFDPDFCHNLLTAQEIVFENPVLLYWLKSGQEQGIIPTPRFDSEYYLDRYVDVRDADMDPFYHFLTFGQYEGRTPIPAAQNLDSLICCLIDQAGVTLPDLLAMFPVGYELSLTENNNFDKLQNIFQPDFYLAQFPEELSEEVKHKLTFEHFVGIGAAAGYRPTILFNEEYYRRNLDNALIREQKDLSVISESGNGNNFPLMPISSTDILFWHWFCIGWPNQILPTPLFDEELYRHAHKDLGNWKSWIFDHYIQFGVKEKFRSSSTIFNSHYYCKQRKKTVSTIPLVDFILAGDADGIRPAPDVSLASFREIDNSPDTLKRMTRIECCAIKLRDKLERLNSPELKPLIDHAAYIEPMVLRPYGRRELQWPPIKHSVIGLVGVLSDLRKSLNETHYDTVVLIPHCRIAGSARVAGTMVKALRYLYPKESLLLVLTDLSDFQRPDWFADDIHTLDLFDSIKELEGMAGKVMALLDLIRGLTPKRVINVNSRLCWDMMQIYGKQIATWTDIFAYLFTWDLDKHGNKGGYPINWFYPSFNAYSGILVDNAPLVAEIIDRYVLSQTLRNKIHLLHTPADPADFSCERKFESRRRQGKRLRCFWIGRFDRQKRFDIVVEIANLLPDLEILVWGKPVLEDFVVDWKALPSNIKLQGIFDDFDEVPINSFDFFLYTSEWDGLPTILIDMGAHGIATVASRVGGTVDLINETTAWPVDDILNPVAYVQAIEAMQMDPAEVTRRASAFKKHTLAVCNEEQYRDVLREVFTGGKNV